MKQITTKQDFYALSKRLLLGNRLTQWTPKEYRALYSSANHGGLPEIIGIRHAGDAFAGNKSFRTDRDSAMMYVRANDEDRILLDEAVDDEYITFQGEVMPDERHLYLRYSYRKCYQREVWASGDYQHAYGLHASALLRSYMDDDSYQCLNDIFRDYEYPVIEFACFDRRMGMLGWNTITWEVRTNY